MASKRLESSLGSLTRSVCHQCRVSTRLAGSLHTRMLSTNTETTRSDSLAAAHITTSGTPQTQTQSPVRRAITPRDRAGHPPNPFLKTADVTLYSFPEYAPISSKSYPATHLLLPLRRDILHRAVVYEGDKTRQGTAHTLTRWEVRGSNRKIRPQKGTGMARLGDKKSPMLTGGGVAFGPKPRSFATDLPQKVYDLAWRTALSYRFRRGELVVLDGQAEISRDGPGADRWVKEMLEWNGWGRSHGGSLILTKEKRANLWEALGRTDKEIETSMRPHGRCLSADEVDVKDLLEQGRVIVERSALDQILREHTSDLQSSVKILPQLRA